MNMQNPSYYLFQKNRIMKYLSLFLTLIILVSCSFDKKTGIWSGSDEEKKQLSDLEKEQKQILDVVKIYSTQNTYSEEISYSKSLSLSKPINQKSWKMSGLNLQNSLGHNYLPGIDNKFLKKKVGKDKFSIYQMSTSPLIYQNSIIFVDDAGNIFNVNMKGKINWKRNIYKKVFKKVYKKLSIFIYNEAIYISDNIGFIYSLNFQDGKINWIKNHGVPLKSNLKLFKDKIYVINQDNRILCLSAKDGSLIWDIRSISSFIKSQNFLSIAISKDEDVFSLISSGELIKVNAETGSIGWMLNTRETMLSSTDFFKSSDVVISDKNIIFSAFESLYSFNVTSGFLNWEKKIGSTKTPIVDGDYVFVLTDNGYFVAVDKSKGKTIWSTNIFKILKKKKRNTFVSGYILASEKVYITTNNGYLIVCSAKTGKTEYLKKIGDKIASSPIINNGSLYILTAESRLLGFN